MSLLFDRDTYAYLCTYNTQLLPHEPRQNIPQKSKIDISFLDLEFCIARVQGEGRGVRFACFYGAGEEVEGEDFHCEDCGQSERLGGRRRVQLDG